MEVFLNGMFRKHNNYLVEEPSKFYILLRYDEEFLVMFFELM